MSSEAAKCYSHLSQQRRFKRWVATSVGDTGRISPSQYSTGGVKAGTTFGGNVAKSFNSLKTWQTFDPAISPLERCP